MKPLFENRETPIRDRINRYHNRPRSMKDNEKKNLTWSKIWLLITGLIFCGILVTSFVSIIIMKETVFDTTIFVTSITVSGSIFGSNLCWYSKKATSENHYKLRISMYEDIINDRLYFNEEMMKLKKKYNMTEEDVDDIDNSGEIDELMDDEFNDMHNKMDEDRDIAETENEIEEFG